MNVEKTHIFSGHFAAVYALALENGETGTFLSAGGDGHIVRWRLDQPDQGQVVATVSGKVFSLFYDEKNAQIIAGDMNGGLHWIKLHADAPAEVVGRALHKKAIFDLSQGNTSEWLFSLGGDGVLAKWSLEKTRAVESLQLSHQNLRGMATSPTHSLSAIAASDGNIYLVDANRMEWLRTLETAHNSSVFSVAWSPDGRYLLSGGRDATLKIWDADRDFEQVSELPAHWFTINHLAFSPSGRYFATASRDKSLKIWKTADFSLCKVVSLPRFPAHVNSVNHLLWMSDDLLLSTGDDKMVFGWSVFW